MIRKTLIEIECDGCHQCNYLVAQAAPGAELITDEMLLSIDWLQLAGGHFCSVKCLRDYSQRESEQFTERLKAAMGTINGAAAPEG